LRIRKIAIVTGGLGFIGSHLVDLLIEQGLAVRIIDNLIGGRKNNLSHLNARSGVEIIEKDIRDLRPNGSEFSGATYVFHLAGIGDIVPSIESPDEYLDVNVRGTTKVLEAARHAGVSRLVYAASSSCYGLAETPTKESAPIDPKYPYALSKYLGELVSFHWYQVYGLSVNSVCIFNAYGPRVRTKGAYGAVFGVFLKQRLEDKPLTIVGDGTQQRDFIHVKDVAKAFWLASQTEVAGERFNIGAGMPISVNQLAELIGGQVAYIPKRPGEPEVTLADIGKARRILGWEPTINFREGVEEMLEEIELWRDAPLWDSESIAKSTQLWFKFLDKS